MMKNRKVAAALLVLLNLAAARNVCAQAQLNSERMAAATELLKAMNIDTAFFTAGQDLSGEMMGRMPNGAEVRAIMKEFTAKYMPPSKLKAEMTRLYAVAFTTRELRELTAFYRTPLGQKTARVQPQISADFARFTQAEMMKHMPELQQMMMQKMKN